MTLRQRIARLLDPHVREVGPKALITRAYVRRYTCVGCSGHGYSITTIPEMHPQRLLCPTCGIRMRQDIHIDDHTYPIVIDAQVVASTIKESNA
ncbi:MAG: hypothetical protein WC700_17095 [Gemmatimonadaceae bacterium]|jgi:hypothetical protein